MICPHLGLRDDPATVAGFVHTGHVCSRPDSPAPIRADIQTRFCLAGRYPRCPVYQGRVERPPRPPRSLRRALWRAGRAAWEGMTLRQAAGLILFVVVIPATLGAALALLSNNGGGGDAAQPTLASREALGDGASAASPGPSPDAEGGAGSDVSGAPDPPGQPGSGAAPLAQGTPEEQLRAWETVTDWTVGPGDSLIAIALEFDTTPEAIAFFNGLPDDQIFIGDVLSLPVGFRLELTPVTEEEAPQPVVGENGADDATGDAGDADGADAPPTAPPPSLVLDAEAQAALEAWPNLVVWTVQAGDSIFAIALEFSTTVNAVALFNALDADAALQIGEVLQVPVGFTQPLFVPDGASGDE